jgi:thioredoxin 1
LADFRTEEEVFDKELSAAGEKACIVDFFALWCGPCKVIAPKLVKMAEDFPDIVVMKVDVDEAEDVAAECQIEAMPTFCVFKGGKEIKEDRVMGASEEKLKALFTKYSSH